MAKKITEEEAIIMRDKESKDFYHSRTLKNKNGSPKKGLNGDALLHDNLKYKTVYEDVETTGKDGKISVETVKTDVRVGGYQITVNRK